MDPLTHTLMGVTAGNLGARGWRPYAVLIVSSLLPDIDYATLFAGVREFLLYHRGVTHGAFALIVFPALVGFLFGGRKKFIRYYALAFVGHLLHLGFDLTNTVGVRVFAPIDDTPYSLDLLYAVEPAVMAILIGGIMAGRMKPDRARSIAAASILLVAAVVGAKYCLHGRAVEFARTRMDSHVIRRISPMPNDFIRWHMVTKKDGLLNEGYVDLLARKAMIEGSFDAVPRGQAIDASKGTAEVQAFLLIARNPVAAITREGGWTVVRWNDLLYSAGAYRPLSPWARVNAGGGVVSAGYGDPS